MPSALPHLRHLSLALLALASMAAADKSGPLKLCLECHRGDKAKGDINLDVLPEGTLAERIATRALLDDALGQVERQEMPPAKAKQQPTAAERTALMAWLGERVTALDRAIPPQAGRVTMRRLNRLEYRTTIRDLTGLTFDVHFDPTRDFPEDGTGHGFDSIGSALAISPLLMERYLMAAEEILRKALVLEGLDGQRTWSVSGDALVYSAVDPKQKTGTALGRWAGQFEIPQTGDYLLKVRMKSTKDEAKREAAMAWVIDDQRPQDFGWKRSLKPTMSERRLKLEEGFHQIGVNYDGEREGKDSKTVLPPGADDGLITVEAIEISGPVGLSFDKLPDSHRRIIPLRPSKELSRTDAARQVLSGFARKAFRRPAKPDEIDRLMAVFAQADSDGASFERALFAPLSAILVSPHFLYRVEPDRAVDQATNAFALSSHEIASRLSYFLWSSMPDDELSKVADGGTLTEPKVIATQVARMLKDPKAAALPAAFVPQWLQILRVETFMPDKKSAGELGTDLRRAMLQEPVMLFQHALDGNLPLKELLAPDYTFLNEELAKLYDIKGIEDPPFEKGKGNGKNRALRLTKLAGEVRGGILTMGAVLTASSYPDRTSAVRRGKFVLEAILGSPPPPPPADANTELPEEKKDAKGVVQTLRQRLELHRADVVCAGCHARMDPLGFGLENFNPIGKWREQDGSKQKIDSSGTLPDGKTFNGPVALKKILLERQNEFARCLVEKLMTYALGRGLEPADARIVKEIAAAHQSRGYPVGDLVTAICLSTPFRYQSAP